jgi:hypothetical protein
MGLLYGRHDCLAEDFPIRFAFMPVCPPRRNDSTLSLRHIGVDHRDLNAVYNADGIHADLAVLKAIVHLLKRGPLKDQDGVLKRNAMLVMFRRFFFGSQT